MVLFLWNKSFSAAMKARFSLRREWSHALLEQTVCIVITLEFRPEKIVSWTLKAQRKMLEMIWSNTIIL